MLTSFKLLLATCFVVLFVVWFTHYELTSSLTVTKDTTDAATILKRFYSNDNTDFRRKNQKESMENENKTERQEIPDTQQDIESLHIMHRATTTQQPTTQHPTMRRTKPTTQQLSTHPTTSTIYPPTTTTKPTIITKNLATLLNTTETLESTTPSATKSTKPRKRVLIFTALFGDKTWRDIPMDYKFTEIDGKPCPIDECEVTYDIKRINESDAVFFSGRDINGFKVKYLRNLRQVNPKQVWIWMMHESPVFTYTNLTVYDEFFDWTATYRPSSEIFIPYFGIMKLSDKDNAPTQGTNFASGKDKKVLVIISHCDDYRMNMIRKLKQYISVDLYGACKDIINPELPQCVRNTEECETLQARYKFYFAIENSYCNDYVTEKYYKNGLIRHIVPVVLSGGNFTNVNIALPHSFINILDFSNMKSLGEYLNYLDSNDTAYNEYHAWSYTHKVTLRHGMCKVCKALWEHEEYPKIKNAKLSDIWDPKTNCISYKDTMFQKYLL